LCLESGQADEVRKTFVIAFASLGQAMAGGDKKYLYIAVEF
jgi:hypothetical protein